MPYRPDFSAHAPRPALRRYEDRVGRLHRGEQEVGYVLALVESYCEQAGGHLWWRRWSTAEDALNLWTIIDGTFSDSWVPDEVIDEELSDYAAGRFTYYGEPLRVVWADADESTRLRREHFDARPARRGGRRTAAGQHEPSSVPSSPPPQPSGAPWKGRPSGPAFADMLLARAEQVGVAVDVDVQPWQEAGGYGVGADWDDSTGDGCACEVADWVDGVRILDSGDADATVAQALTCFGHRLQGASIREAMEASGVWRTPRRRRRTGWRGVADRVCERRLAELLSSASVYTAQPLDVEESRAAQGWRFSVSVFGNPWEFDPTAAHVGVAVHPPGPRRLLSRPVTRDAVVHQDGSADVG